MKLSSTLFTDGYRIPGDCAFCLPDPARHVRLGKNIQPPLFWQDAPAATRSFALICHDPDAPVDVTKANREGHCLTTAMPRTDFFHWLVFDLPADLREIPKGAFASQVVPYGEAAPPAPFGAHQGINEFTEGTTGDHYGYDGPCPPWNDDVLHRYHFTLYALETARLPLQGRPEANAILSAIRPHILAEARLTGTYSLNPHRYP